MAKNPIGERFLYPCLQNSQPNFWIVGVEQLQDLACNSANYNKNTKIRQNLFMFQPCGTMRCFVIMNPKINY